MLSPNDINIIRELFQQALSIENTLSDKLLMTFHYYTKSPTGGNVGRHLDNTPLDPWSSNIGFTATEKTKTLQCVYIPPVMKNDLVQEGYHPSSDVEIYILGRDLNQANITLDDIRNSFEYVSMPHPHEIGLLGRTESSVLRLWNIISIRPLMVSNQLVSVTLGLVLREQDATQVGVGDKP